MSSAAPAPRTRGALVTVYLAVFIDLFGFGILLPALPYYAQKLGASGLTLGILFSSYSVAQLLGAAALGRLSDRFGRRPVMLASLAGSAVSFALCALATTLPMLAGARALAGLFGGSIAAAQAVIADVTRPEERARFMGLLGAAVGLGFVAGPAVGALLAPWGFGAAAWVAAGMALLNLALAAVLLQETRHPASDAARRFRFDLLLSALERRPLNRYLAATFLNTFAFLALEVTLAFLIAQRFALHERGFGGIMVFVGVLIVIGQGGLVGPLTRRLGEARLATWSCVGLALALLAVPSMPTLPLLLVALGAAALTQSLASPSLATLLSRASGADEQGGVLGLGQSLSALARAVSPAIAGALWDLGALWPYAAGAAVAVVAAAAVGSGRSPAGQQL